MAGPSVELRPTFMRACLALLAGSAVGAALSIAAVAGPAFIGGLQFPGEARLLPLDALFALCVSSTAICAGLIALIAAPLWWILGRAGPQKWFYAPLLGFVVTSFVWLLFDGLTARQLFDSFFETLLFGTAGAVAGLTTWWVAYGG